MPSNASTKRRAPTDLVTRPAKRRSTSPTEYDMSHDIPTLIVQSPTTQTSHAGSSSSHDLNAFRFLPSHTSPLSHASDASSSSVVEISNLPSSSSWAPRSFLDSPGVPRVVGRSLQMGKPSIFGALGKRGKKKPRKKHIHDAVHKASIKENTISQLMHLKEIPWPPVSFLSSLSWLSGTRAYADLIGGLEAREKLAPLPNSQTSNRHTSSLTTVDTLGTTIADDIKRHIQFSRKRATAARDAPRPELPTLEELRINDRRLDQEIENRIRPPKRELPSSLSQAHEYYVDEQLQKRGVVISSVGREQVQAEDLQRLRPSCWLNDEIINFFGAMIVDRAARWAKGDTSDAYHGYDEKEKNAGGGEVNKDEPGHPLSVHYFNTFFYAKLCDPGYDKARLNKWTKKVDIFAKDVVLIPINLGNSHWTCAIINVRRKRVEYYDSLGNRRENVYLRLRDYLEREAKDKKKKFDWDADGWTEYFSTDTPGQDNAYDCGVFTCQFMEAASRGVDVERFVFSQKNMAYLRRRMVWEIGNGRLMGWK